MPGIYMNRSPGGLFSLPPSPPIPILTSDTMSFKVKEELEEYSVPKAPLSLTPQHMPAQLSTI